MVASGELPNSVLDDEAVENGDQEQSMGVSPSNEETIEVVPRSIAVGDCSAQHAPGQHGTGDISTCDSVLAVWLLLPPLRHANSDLTKGNHFVLLHALA